MQKTIIILLSIIATLLVVIFVALMAKKDGSTSAASVNPDEQDVGAALDMLPIADTLPNEFEKQMWILATSFALDHYTDHGRPLPVSAKEINIATAGFRMLSPPDNGLFPIEWKLVRKDTLGLTDGSIPPTWLTCDSAGGFSYEMHDRIAQEWQRALWLMPKSDWDAVYKMMVIGSALHETQANKPEEFESRVNQQRTNAPEIQIDHSIYKDPYRFDLNLSHKSNWFSSNYLVHENYDGSRCVLQIHCLNPSFPSTTE